MKHTRNTARIAIALGLAALLSSCATSRTPVSFSGSKGSGPGAGKCCF